jgi:hypothetical protein
MGVRLQTTVSLAEVGFWPRVMVPLSVVLPPGATGLGEAVPVAVGLIETLLTLAVRLKSSIATPSSLPPVSTSVHRIKKLWPSGMARPEMVALIACRHAAELPLVAMFCVTEQASPGEAKLRRRRIKKAPVVAGGIGAVGEHQALRLGRGGRARRHISPV